MKIITAACAYVDIWRLCWKIEHDYEWNVSYITHRGWNAFILMNWIQLQTNVCTRLLKWSIAWLFSYGTSPTDVINDQWLDFRFRFQTVLSSKTWLLHEVWFGIRCLVFEIAIWILLGCKHMQSKSLTKHNLPSNPLLTSTLIARFMGPYGSHLGPTGPRWAPCGPRELCYLVSDSSLYNSFHFGKIKLNPCRFIAEQCTHPTA